MTNRKALFLALLMAGVASAEVRVYDLRPGAPSRAELTVEKTGLLSGKKHLFTFSQYEGTFRFDSANATASTVEFFLRAGSILCRDTWLSAKDLRKVQEYAIKDMLAADRHPQIRFRSIGIKKVDPNRYEVEGILTIRNVSKPAVVTASLTGSSESLSIEGTARVRLTDFGLKPPSAALGTVGTRNEMVFHFILPATGSAGSASGDE
jgi:polyisoprenoid-binding protein YceI